MKNNPEFRVPPRHKVNIKKKGIIVKKETVIDTIANASNTYVKTRIAARTKSHAKCASHESNCHNFCTS